MSEEQSRRTRLRTWERASEWPLTLAALVFTELQIKAFQKLAVLIFGGHDLDLVVHFVAEQHQCLLRH